MNQFSKKVTITFSVLIFTLSLFFTSSTFAFSDDWSIYHGASLKHPFIFRIPPGWQPFKTGETKNHFSPDVARANILFDAIEFEKTSIDDAINYFTTENIIFVSEKDIILPTPKEDLIAKKVIYKNLEKELEFEKIFIKRTDLVLALTAANIEGVSNFPIPDYQNENIKGILSSFQFEDNRSTYIDFKSQYSFNYPTHLKSSSVSNGVEIYSPGYPGGVLFSVKEYDTSSLDEAISMATAIEKEYLTDTTPFNFNGYDQSRLAVFKDRNTEKENSRIFVLYKDKVYELTNINFEDNYPHFNYYDRYILDFQKSFQFFDLSNSNDTFVHFPDVRNDHPNAEAINNLIDKEIISGFEDGTYKPDSELTKAELIKIVVSLVTEPSSATYNNCFEDVTNEWFAPYICYAKEQGVISSPENNIFEPNETIKRVEALKLIFELLSPDLIDETETLKNETISDIDKKSWYEKYFIFADNNTLLDKQHIKEQSDGSYHYLPMEGFTRKEAAETIFRLQKLQESQENISEDIEVTN